MHDVLVNPAVGQTVETDRDQLAAAQGKHPVSPCRVGENSSWRLRREGSAQKQLKSPKRRGWLPKTVRQVVQMVAGINRDAPQALACGIAVFAGHA